jgi:hypothetical protein
VGDVPGRDLTHRAQKRKFQTEEVHAGNKRLYSAMLRKQCYRIFLDTCPLVSCGLSAASAVASRCDLPRSTCMYRSSLQRFIDFTLGTTWLLTHSDQSPHTYSAHRGLPETWQNGNNTYRNPRNERTRSTDISQGHKTLPAGPHLSHFIPIRIFP